MHKRVAALDLGTNTFHLIIADVEDGSIKEVLLAEQRHVKLGEGGIADGKISDSAFSRGIEALKEFSNLCKSHYVHEFRAVGTAALRSARNGINFIQEAKTLAGFSIEIIDGDLEATLIYRGVKQAVDITKPALIMDIGGGSVEFILADTQGINWKHSYPIGAARLMALFHKSDPISQTDINNIHKHLDEISVDLKTKVDEFLPQQLVGSAGAFETYAALIADKFSLEKSSLKDKSFNFNLSQLMEVLTDIQCSNHSQRAANSAIIPVRVDMIVVAAILTQYVVEISKVRDVRLSAYALKEGLLIA